MDSRSSVDWNAIDLSDLKVEDEPMTFEQATGWFDDLPDDANLADLLIATLRSLSAKNELLSVALEKLAEQEQEITRQRKRIEALVEENRTVRKIA